MTQTLERTQEPLDTAHTAAPRRKRRWMALLLGAVVIVAITALVSYALTSAQTETRTIVKTVPAPHKATAPAVDDRGFSLLDNGHQAETNVFQQPLTAVQQHELQHQLELARQAAMRYPTVKDAEAAGWRRAGPFAPGLGAHFFKFGGVGGSGFVPEGPITDAAILAPASLIYDGTHPNSRIAGLMYLGTGFRIPQGYVGPNDIWHYHTDVCTVFKPDGSIDTPFGADTTVTQAMCDTVGGQLQARTPYMLHTWVVAGYDSPEGVFSHLNEAITCRDGSYRTIPLADVGTRSSVCVDGGE